MERPKQKSQVALEFISLYRYIGTCILEGFAQNFGYLEKLMLRLFQKAAGNLMDDAFYLYLSLVFS